MTATRSRVFDGSQLWSGNDVAAALLFRRLQAGGFDPVVQMIGHFGLAGLLEQSVALGTRGKPGGVVLDLLHPCGKPVLKGQLLLETSSLEHGTPVSV
ncbi:hypothetical protein SE92_09055 [Bradyrhizobium sp. AT1]|nr:hypothetical protein SE92_09055 [Bradyrhizobium sp. AT1]